MKYGFGIKIIPSQKLAFLQYVFYDTHGEEIDMKEEIEIKQTEKAARSKRVAFLFYLFSSTIHFSILRVSALKFTPILKSFRSSISKGRA